MSETKLLSCPFCGGEAKICNGSNNIVGSQYAIRCKALNCTIRPVTEWHEELDEAIRHWNTRNPMNDIVEQLEKHKSYNQMMLKKFPKMGTIENAIYKTQRDTYENAIDIVRNAGKDGAE